MPRSDTSRRLRASGSAIRRAAAWPLVVALHLTDQRQIIHDDLVRWKALRVDAGNGSAVAMSDVDMLRLLAATYREYRNIFYFRLDSGNALGTLAAKVARRIWRPVAGFDIACNDVGPGLVVRHGYSTILTAERIGANCFAHHEVTVGWLDENARAPILGDNVYLGAGAKVLGPISIGDDVLVGANAVVIEDVPSGCTVVGVPARIANKRERVRPPNETNEEE